MKIGHFKGQGGVDKNRLLKVGEIQITTNSDPYNTDDYLDVSDTQIVSRDLRGLSFVTDMGGGVYQSAKLMNLPAGFHAFLKLRNTRDE